MRQENIKIERLARIQAQNQNRKIAKLEKTEEEKTFVVTISWFIIALHSVNLYNTKHR